LWRGQPQKAIGFYGESLRAALDYGNEMEAATEMEGMAMGLAGSGQDEKALRLHGASSARNKELHTTAEDQIAFWIELRERYLTPARERLGPAAAERAEAEGRNMGWPRALARAFEWAARSR
jgi:hypothetical protein